MVFERFRYSCNQFKVINKNRTWVALNYDDKYHHINVIDPVTNHSGLILNDVSIQDWSYFIPYLSSELIKIETATSSLINLIWINFNRSFEIIVHASNVFICNHYGDFEYRIDGYIDKTYEGSMNIKTTPMEQVVNEWNEQYNQLKGNKNADN